MTRRIEYTLELRHADTGETTTLTGTIGRHNLDNWGDMAGSVAEGFAGWNADLQALADRLHAEWGEQIINAIRDFRSRTGTSLREAKDAMEAARDRAKAAA